MQEYTSEYQLLEGFSDPVILVDETRQIVYANSAASDVMDVTTIGRDLAISFRHPSALEAVDNVLKDQFERITEITISAPIPQTFQLQAKRVELINGGGHGGWVNNCFCLLYTSPSQRHRG